MVEKNKGVVIFPLQKRSKNMKEGYESQLYYEKGNNAI